MFAEVWQSQEHLISIYKKNWTTVEVVLLHKNHPHNCHSGSTCRIEVIHDHVSLCS
jgi:hypothetical protein